MSSHWPTYEEWFASLAHADQERARELTRLFRSLGTEDAESWARSEISENIPQLARFLVLNIIRKHALDYWRLTGVLDEVAKENKTVERLIKHLRQSGFRDAEIELFAQRVAAITAWQIVHTLDEGCDVDATERLPGWSLGEVDADGNGTGRNIGGLHESFYEFDPTRVGDDR